MLSKIPNSQGYSNKQNIKKCAIDTLLLYNIFFNFTITLRKKIITLWHRAQCGVSTLNGLLKFATSSMYTMCLFKAKLYLKKSVFAF